jgi:hypothetical protein
MPAKVVNLDTNTDGVFMDKTKKGSWLQTITGKRVSVLAPQPEEIFIEDIIPSISKQCRFNGHCNVFYSVAQHCVLGAQFALHHWKSKDVAKEFLLHDATEAYMGDLIRPVKVMLPEFGVVEAGFWKAISSKFGLPFEHTEKCQLLDNIMVTWEKRDLLPQSEVWPNLPDITEYNLSVIDGWSWEDSMYNYELMYGRLFSAENSFTRY